MTSFRREMEYIVQESIRAVLPDTAVKEALADFVRPKGRLILIAAGKAAYSMAAAALELLGRVDAGLCITKYGHAKGSLPGVTCREAAHPVQDEKGFAATEEALQLVSGLTEEDAVLFLLSGGGSALFESPAVAPEELQNITQALLRCGADITEINTLRKRLSRVKGGRFAEACAPARVFNVILSDVLGNDPSVIASGPTYPDASTASDALAVAEKYALTLSEDARRCLLRETPKTLPNVTTRITGSVKELCAAAAKACLSLGYESRILTEDLTCEARQAGADLAAAAKTELSDYKCPTALIMGGETIVRVTGQGLGGRNQELALAASETIRDLPIAVFSLGSDGTDGPTDAAGGFVDGGSFAALERLGLSPAAVLAENDAYHALQAIDGLIVTGPTGTNVNDVAVALIRK